PAHRRRARRQPGRAGRGDRGRGDHGDPDPVHHHRSAEGPRAADPGGTEGRDPVTITLGVTLYSMTNEWLAGRYTLPELVDEVARRGIGPGVELIGFQSLRGFPDQVSPQDLRSLRDAV